MRIRDIGEIGLIKRLAKKSRYDPSVVRGIGDDAAVIRWTRNKYLLFTCDMLVEDVHFCRGTATPFQIGWKALARNISDIAAMGGVPRYAVVSAGLKASLPIAFFDGIYRGIRSVAKRFKVNLVGGDMARSDKLILDVSLIGEVEKKNLILRSGARPGDVILVTGSLGGSLEGKHLNFMPRLDEARELVRNFKIGSMIDVSDGLVLDLWRMLEASSAGGRIYRSLIPVSRKAHSFDKAIHDGEDFELLFTMRPAQAQRLLRACHKKMKTAVTLIGEVTDKKYGYRLITKDGKEKSLKAKGYLHFGVK